jgi:hypothetical protein
VADWSHPPEVRFDELVQPARLELALLDLQVVREIGRDRAMAVTKSGAMGEVAIY